MSGMEGLSIVANVIAVVDLSLKVISWCSKYAQDVKDSSDGRARLLQAAITLHYESGKTHDLLSSKRGNKLKASQKLAQAMGSSEVQLRELETLLSDKASCSSLRWPLRKEKVESAIRNIENAIRTLLEVLQIDTTRVILDIDDRTEAGQRRAAIDQLPYVSDAAWDSHAEEHNATCLKNTRIDILQDINDWVEDTADQAKTVFWLNGMAGTGKSTISRTIARSLFETKRLGASFFFKRGETNRGSISRFVPTIARQLVANQPVLEPCIHEAVLHEPSITSKAVRVQFERLIMEPLSRCPNDFHKDTPIAIIVDALDECESDADIYLIINLLSGTRKIQRPRPRIFVTSHPDLPIRLGFNDVQGTYQDLILHEIPAQVIEHDITIFLEHETEQIKRRWNHSVAEIRRLATDWPGNECIRLLTRRAAPLFIVAATECRFIADRRHGSPEEQLHRLLNSSADSTSSQMDRTYGSVLSQLLGSNCSKRKKEAIIHEVKRIVGTIINLASPLSSSALSRLVKIDQKTIDTRLDFLHSVLSVPSSSEAPIRMLHASFRDYLMDLDAKGNPFWIDGIISAQAILRDCFRVMGSLKADICHLGFPGTPRTTLKAEFIDACIPLEVQYACIYWIHHQVVAGVGHGDVKRIFEFLEEHLLHWIEALNLLGRAYQITGLIRNLRSILDIKSESDKQLIAFLDDAIRFVDTDMETINLTPLQIYSSVLAFAPTNSVVQKTFSADTPGWMEIVTGRRSDWDPRLRSFHNYSHQNEHVKLSHSTMFSPDSKLLCSTFGESLRIWSCDTGECIEDLKTDEDPLMAVSPNGRYLAATTTNAKYRIRLLSLESVGHLSELAQDKALGALAFSKDSALLWTCSIDGEVKVWDVETRKCVRELKYPENWAQTIRYPIKMDKDPSWIDEGQLTFSMNYKPVLLLSEGETHAHILFLESGEENLSFDIEISCSDVSDPIRFSPDGKLLAAPSAHGSVIMIWDLRTRVCLWKLVRYDFSYTEDLVPSGSLTGHLLFSQDSGLLAIAYRDRKILVWDMQSGDCSAKLAVNCSTHLPVIAFSSNKEFLLIANEIEVGFRDHIEAWNLNKGSRMAATRCHMDNIQYLLFSSDGKSFVSGLFGGEIKLWDWPSFLGESLEDAREMESLVLSPDASIAAACYGGNELRTWDAVTGEMLQELTTGLALSNIFSLSFSPNSSFIATANTSNAAAVWNARNGRCEWQFRGSSQNIQVQFSPNSQRIAVSHEGPESGYRIDVWKHASGSFSLEYTRDKAWGNFFMFSQCGSVLFLGHMSGKWGFHCAAGKLLHGIHMDPTQSEALSMAISGDSSVLALGFRFQVEVWDLESMRCINRWKSKFGANLSFSSTGTLLAGGSGQTTRIRDYITGEVVADIEFAEQDREMHSFLPDNSGIRTNYGDIVLSSSTVPQQHLAPKFGLKDRWIQWNGHNLIKLPVDLSGVETAVAGTACELTIAFGCSWERVVILKLSEDEELLKLLPLLEETTHIA
ncbi:hypothetical protein BFJ70_g1278 [Fusarium oxysporum]|nr:hypothetical protein BFJ70_g1278 [Fusarium oxysporum]